MRKVFQKCVSFLLIILIIRETDLPGTSEWLLSGGGGGSGGPNPSTVALMIKRLTIMQARAQKMAIDCQNRVRANKDLTPIGKWDQATPIGK